MERTRLLTSAALTFFFFFFLAPNRDSAFSPTETSHRMVLILGLAGQTRRCPSKRHPTNQPVDRSIAMRGELHSIHSIPFHSNAESLLTRAFFRVLTFERLDLVRHVLDPLHADKRAPSVGPVRGSRPASRVHAYLRHGAVFWSVRVVFPR